MKNNTLKEIGDKLLSADSVLLFPHIVMDGDTLGSSVALCRALRAKGKTAYILIEDEIPVYLQFLDDGLCTFDLNAIKNPDVCVMVDFADSERFALRREKFLEAGCTICVDHHKTSECFTELSHVDSNAAATAEIVYDLICEMGVPIDKWAGEAIYAAILTDTGNFQYSNTRAKSHIITIELFNLGIDHNYVSRMLYQSNRIERLNISGEILSTLKSMAGGSAVMAHVTRVMLAEVGALIEDTEGTSEMLRSVKGVELSVFAKETGESETKFSMRSKTWADVSEIAVIYGGGGHLRAAGCTIRKPIAEAMKMIEETVEEYFEKYGENRL